MNASDKIDILVLFVDNQSVIVDSDMKITLYTVTGKNRSSLW